MTGQPEFPKDFKNYLRTNTLVEIKGGRERETFLNIWMVQVGDRYFSRSWNRSKKSWFTDIINSGVGQIRYGESILNVNGKKLPANDPTQEKINLAYLTKYNQQENLIYSQGITQPEYAHYTIEFFIDQKIK
ncbi:DUF2255 family protein [Salinimicrobium sediminilitoris]|uniref:DUF2255 family protein n=1 Tax=Salinimicrobium sediminilitoris TaxID=2876715 RepID=UPI001E362BDF|nr:DUF2255 family protein [Salinimicrobium sediminilitoris]MCC8359079.1 DUF2255 family protein [Salinimicrobium sediminilitoris]